jgi:hypothetical protein
VTGGHARPNGAGKPLSSDATCPQRATNHAPPRWMN